MAYDATLAERIRQRLARRTVIEEKTLFGCAGFLLGGNVLVGVWRKSLIVRLGPEEGEEALKEAHVGEFDITGRAMKGRDAHFLSRLQTWTSWPLLEEKAVGRSLSAAKQTRC